MQPCNIIFVSPHLDDAIISCGGLIHRLIKLGIKVKIITVFAGSSTGNLSPFAEWMQKEWNLPFDAPGARRTEDLNAISSIGAEAIHLQFPCSIYRFDLKTGKFLYTSKTDIFSGECLQEPKILPDMIQEINTKINIRTPEILFIPLSIGGHIDHILTRKALEAIYLPEEKKRLIYYEDFPYVLRYFNLQNESKKQEINGLQSLIIQLSISDLESREFASRCYKSQSQETAKVIGLPLDQIRPYAASVLGKKGGFGERYWSSEPSCFQTLKAVLGIGS